MNFNSIIRFCMLFSLILLLSNPTSGNGINGFSGSISEDHIEKGSDVMFSGSIHNLQNQVIFLFSMNVTFTEDIRLSSSRLPKLLNITKYYGTFGFQLESNSTFTDVIKAKINYEPGNYNVSIYFDYGEQGSISSEWNSTYALANQTLEISGATQSIKYARAFAIFLGSMTTIIIILLIYNKINKKG